MADFVTLSCPNCGGKLEITPDIDRFACAYCGQEQIVNRGHGVVSLKPVIDNLEAVQQAVNLNAHFSSRAADELALQRLEKEIAAANAQAEKEMGWLSGQRSTRDNNTNFGVICFVVAVLVFL
jgi:hypothetical protein